MKWPCIGENPLLSCTLNPCLTRSATSGVEFGTVTSASSNLRVKAGDDHPKSVIVTGEKNGGHGGKVGKGHEG